MSIPDSDYYRWRQLMVEVAGEQLTYVTKPGLFSWEALDAGTRLLIETLRTHPLSPEARALDVGSGSGALTLVAARQADKGSVIGVDVDCRAVEATRRTLALGALANAQATLSDCAEAVWGQTFTSIVTNPPFHREQATTYALAEQIIADACQLLEQRGQLYLVANSFLRYGPILESAFGNAQVLRQNNRYRVWYAVKGR
jgi:16S rRNA (guanine1207-N2)-methyltransferase